MKTLFPWPPAPPRVIVWHHIHTTEPIKATPMQSAEISRKNMIDGQIKPNKVVDEKLLEIMGKLPRERFVPRHMQGLAYIDEDIPMGNGRFLPEPMVIARLLQELGIGTDDIVLDIACGTGYSTALMAMMASTVVGIESSREMAEQADQLLREQNILNVAVVHQAELRQGYPQQAPYDVILINGAVPDLPEALLQQLAEGGRLGAVLSANGRMGQAVIVTRFGGHFSTRPLFDAATPVLPAFASTKKFEF